MITNKCSVTCPHFSIFGFSVDKGVYPKCSLLSFPMDLFFLSFLSTCLNSQPCGHFLVSFTNVLNYRHGKGDSSRRADRALCGETASLGTVLPVANAWRHGWAGDGPSGWPCIVLPSGSTQAPTTLLYAGLPRVLPLLLVTGVRWIDIFWAPEVPC